MLPIEVHIAAKFLVVISVDVFAEFLLHSCNLLRYFVPSFYYVMTFFVEMCILYVIESLDTFISLERNLICNWCHLLTENW